MYLLKDYKYINQEKMQSNHSSMKANSESDSENNKNTGAEV
jgi:hypothetical protein